MDIGRTCLCLIGRTIPYGGGSTSKAKPLCMVKPWLNSKMEGP